RLARFAAGLFPILNEQDVALFRSYLAEWEELLGDVSALAEASDAELRRTMRDLRLRPAQFGLPAWPRTPPATLEPGAATPPPAEAPSPALPAPDNACPEPPAVPRNAPAAASAPGPAAPAPPAEPAPAGDPPEAPPAASRRPARRRAAEPAPEQLTLFDPPSS